MLHCLVSFGSFCDIQIYEWLLLSWNEKWCSSRLFEIMLHDISKITTHDKHDMYLNEAPAIKVLESVQV